MRTTRTAANAEVINTPLALPAATDTGDGLGPLRRLSYNKTYYIGKEIDNTIPMLPNNNRIEVLFANQFNWDGEGALFRSNATTPAGKLHLFGGDYTGNGTNSLFDLQAGTGLFIDYLSFNNFHMGAVSNFNIFGMRQSGINEQKSTLVLDSINSILISSPFFPGAPIGEPLIELRGTVSVVEIRDTILVPIGGDSAFNIDPGITVTGSIKTNNVTVVTAAGGNAFASGSLDQTDLRVFATGCTGLPNSQIIGSIHMDNNSVETVITAKGEDGSFSSVIDTGGGQLTLSSLAHGLNNGDEVWIVADKYAGKYIISNITADSFEIAAIYDGDMDGDWQTHWVKIAGTTYPGENERASMTGNNELTFTNTDQISAIASATVGARNFAVASATDWEFSIMRDDEMIKRSKVQLTNVINSLSLETTSPVVAGKKFELYMRNMSNSSTQGLADNFSLIIK